MSREYVTLRDGSVLGRIIDWDDEGVPIIDTTDRNPGPDIADLARPVPGLPSRGSDVRTEAPVGEPVIPPRPGASRPVAAPDAATGPLHQPRVAPRD